MDETQFNEISGKIDLAVRLLALNLVKDLKVQKEKIMTLSAFGFGPSEIAKLLGTTANTVNVALSEARKKTGKTEQKAADNQTGAMPKEEINPVK